MLVGMKVTRLCDEGGLRPSGALKCVLSHLSRGSFRLAIPYSIQTSNLHTLDWIMQMRRWIHKGEARACYAFRSRVQTSHFTAFAPASQVQIGAEPSAAHPNNPALW
eukprot:5521905-Pleurochrysis_carterae.AAC.2